MKELMIRGYELDRKALRINTDGKIGLYFKKITQYKTDSISPVNILGIDLGRNVAIACSNGNMESIHKTSISLKDILDIIMHRVQGSKNSSQTRKYIQNQINYCLKHDIPWSKISFLALENLKDIKRYKKWGKKNQFWPVAYIREKLNLLAREHGVRIIESNAAYTSQECNVCGFIHKNNRTNESFKCMNCGHEADADHNASVNIYNRGIDSSSAEWNIIEICNMNLRKL
jgi:transposase